MRDARVHKVIGIINDLNSDDDAVTSAVKAKKLTTNQKVLCFTHLPKLIISVK